MHYPSSLQLNKIKDGIKVKRIKNSKYSPDIWAMSYLLNESIAQGCLGQAIHLNVTEPTEILRLYFLPKIFSGYSFLPDVTKKAEKIISKIKKKEYVTYGHDYIFKNRGTKDKQESLLEDYIFNNLSQCFCGAFKADKIGIRQYPANFFRGSVKESNRVGRKFWVDILTVNKLNQLSVIELKAGHNVPLDLFIQAIDYGIFAHLFKEHIADSSFINNRNILDNKVAVYLVAERFHPAIVGDKKTQGITSRLKDNKFFDIHLIQFEKEGNVMKGSKEIPCA